VKHVFVILGDVLKNGGPPGQPTERLVFSPTGGDFTMDRPLKSDGQIDQILGL
jgi:hypothetical protein